MIKTWKKTYSLKPSKLQRYYAWKKTWVWTLSEDPSFDAYEGMLLSGGAFGTYND